MIITRAPLRIPLGGGGTDLASYYAHYGGFVLSAGIDKYVYIQLNDLKVEDFIRVKYSQTEKVEAPDQIQHPLLREALDLRWDRRRHRNQRNVRCPRTHGFGIVRRVHRSIAGRAPRL